MSYNLGTGLLKENANFENDFVNFPKLVMEKLLANNLQDRIDDSPFASDNALAHIIANRQNIHYYKQLHEFCCKHFWLAYNYYNSTLIKSDLIALCQARCEKLFSNLDLDTVTYILTPHVVDLGVKKADLSMKVFAYVNINFFDTSTEIKSTYYELFDQRVEYRLGACELKDQCCAFTHELEIRKAMKQFLIDVR